VVINSQPSLLVLILVGCSLASWTILTLTIDDNPLDSSVQAASIACMATPVIFALGLSLTLLSLVGKMYRIWRLFNNRKMRRITFNVQKSLSMVGSLLGIMVVLIIAWIVLAPLNWQRFIDYSDAHGNPLVSHGSCVFSNSASVIFLALVFTLDAVVLIVAVVVAYEIRSYPSEFQESRYVFLIVTSVGQIFFMAVPTTVAVYTNAIGRFILLSSVVFLTVLVIQFLLFAPKIWLVLTEKELWPGSRRSADNVIDRIRSQKRVEVVDGGSPESQAVTTRAWSQKHSDD